MGEHSIAIIGTGNVGAALGKRFAASGIDVAYGVRSESGEAKARERLGSDARLLPLREAAAGASLVFIATPASAAPAAAQSLGDLTGKVLVDCTNSLAWDNGPVWKPPVEGSVAQQIAALGTGASVVKAFNTFGAEFHGDPRLKTGAVDVQIAGDDASAVALVAEVAAMAGFNPVACGPLRNAAVLENLAVLWIHLAMAAGHGRNVAFKLLPRE